MRPFGGREAISPGGGIPPRLEPIMAKGQKKSNKEARKPKKEAPKPPIQVGSFARGTSDPGKKK